MIRTTVINAVVLGGVALCGTATAWTDDASLRGRIVAIGIPGIAAISPVGTFLPGGPIHNKPALAAYTQPGQALDPARILVRSESSFGEPEAVAGQLHGSFLSAFTMRLSFGGTS